MISLVDANLVFLAIGLLFYVLFGGADFGAGILELFISRKHADEQRRIISHAMAPVWEANHVWLVLVVVILFVGFPTIYTKISVSLHLPVMALLVGIVARGCAFTFRHYDTLGGAYYRTYSAVFSLSSLWTAFFIGVTAGAMMLGRIDLVIPDFSAAYLAPWLNLFCASMGVFVACLFVFLAAIYLCGETRNGSILKILKRRGLFALAGMVVTGACIFALGNSPQFPLAQMFFRNPVSQCSFVLATVLLWPLWRGLRSDKATFRVRAIGVTVITLILLGWFAVQYPVALRTTQGEITFQAAAAPAATLRALLIALVVGVLLILPALGYLFRVFKWEALARKS